MRRLKISISTRRGGSIVAGEGVAVKGEQRMKRGFGRGRGLRLGLELGVRDPLLRRLSSFWLDFTKYKSF